MPKSASSIGISSPPGQVPSETVGVPLIAASRCLVVLACCGAIASLASQYTWLPFRETDLYAWAPGTQTYRPFEGDALFFVPRAYAFSKAGTLRDDVPGIQVFPSSFGESEDAMEQRLLREAPEISVDRIVALDERELSPEWRDLRRKLAIYQHRGVNNNADAPQGDRLVLKRVPIVLDVPSGQSDQDDWMTWLTKPNNLQILVKGFPSRSALVAAYDSKLDSMPYERSYTSSALYHVLMVLPLVLLLVPQGPLTRLFGVHFVSPRRALFSTMPNWFFALKRRLVDPLSVFLCFVDACLDLSRLGLIENLNGLFLSFAFAIVLALAVSAAYARLVANEEHRSDSERSKFAWATFWQAGSMIMLILQALVLGMITWSTYLYEMQHDTRLSSSCMQRVILAQLLLSRPFTEFTWNYKKAKNIPINYRPVDGVSAIEEENIVLSCDDIEAGAAKFAVSFLFYSAGVTKVGESRGLGFIDDRYLAQLALRGHYGLDDRPYPLAPLLLYVPRSFRAAGMAVILAMELGACFSWWYFVPHLLLWFGFMTGSSLSIGVPFRADLMFPFLEAQAAKRFWFVLELIMVALVILGFARCLLRWIAMRASAKTEKTR